MTHISWMYTFYRKPLYRHLFLTGPIMCAALQCTNLKTPFVQPTDHICRNPMSLVYIFKGDHSRLVSSSPRARIQLPNEHNVANPYTSESSIILRSISTSIDYTPPAYNSISLLWSKDVPLSSINFYLY